MQEQRIDTGLQGSVDGPVIYADTVASITTDQDIVRFYLQRTDPPVNGRPERVNIVGQIVLPISGFANTFSLFSSALHNLVSKGVLTSADAAKIIEHFKAVRGDQEGN